MPGSRLHDIVQRPPGRPRTSARHHLATGMALSLALAFGPRPVIAQAPEDNYDEAKVPAYSLPDPLVLSGGARVGDPETWASRRRPEILRLFESQVYGKAPGRPAGLSFEVVRVVKEALGGAATRKEVVVSFAGKEDGPKMDLMVYVPNRGRKPAPAFLGLNFSGNHGVDPDPSIPLARGWMRDNPAKGISGNRASERSRGSEASRWPLARIVERGYAVATAYYGDIDPDYDDGFKNGVHPLSYKPGQDRPAPDEWGSIGAHYAGRWHTPEAESYISNVRRELKRRAWLTPG